MITARTTFYLISILCLWTSVSFGAANAVSSARETSIRHLLIPFFKIKVRDSALEKMWNGKNSDLQEALVKSFTEKSAIEPVLTIKSFELDSKSEVFIAEGTLEKVDAILTAEIHDSEFIVEIVSGLTGRVLDKLKVPIPDALANTSILADSIKDAFLAKLRYVGYITATHNSEAKINVGRKAGVKEGDVLVLFEFDGDHPTFSSHIHRVGVFKLNKVVSDAALGTFTPVSGSVNVPPYTKVFIPRKPVARPVAERSVPVSDTPNINPFWISAGLGAYSLNTQVSGTSNSLQMRNVQVPLTLAGKLSLGYSRLSLDLAYSSASNTSNSLGVMDGNLLVRLTTPAVSKINFYTSLGVFVSQEQVTPQANPTTLLTSSLTFAPELQEMMKWNLTTSYFYGALDLFFPVFSNDSSNGGSTATGSYGLGLEFGWRVTLSKHWAGSIDLQSKYLSIQNQNGKITQSEFYVGPSAIYSF